MGREADLNQKLEQAELERLVGPTRTFGKTQECDKCGLPRDAFAFAFCQGSSLSTRGDQCRVFGEHLHVMCPRCRYGWHEHCKDHTESPNGIVSQ